MIIHPMHETAAPALPNQLSAQLAAALAPRLPQGLCALTHLGIIDAQGADATVFLQGQLTQDVALLAPGSSTLAAYCSAKGRMLASFWVYKVEENHFLLLCSQDLLAATLKRFQMYVLRAKLKLRDVSSEFFTFGLLENSSNSSINLVTNNPHKTLGVLAIEILKVLGQRRAILLESHTEQVDPVLQPTLSPHIWAWTEVMAAVATVTQPVAEAFVPQMLNYESVGGVSFKKGCYPGQEVVARSQFRGTLKRRAYLVESNAPMAVGQEVFSPLNSDQACGTVVQAAPRPPELELVQGQAGNAESAVGRWNAIVSMQVAAAQAGGLTLASATGATLALLPLPYALLDDI